MAIERIENRIAEKALKQLLPGAKHLVPMLIGDLAKEAGWNLELHWFSDPLQSRSDESYLAELMRFAGRFLRGSCVVVPDEAFDKGGTSFRMRPSDLYVFVRCAPYFIFDGDFIVLSPSNRTIVAFHNEGDESVMFVAHP